MSLGVLCLETYYSSEPHDRSTVRGLLEVLETNSNVSVVHRHVAERDDFEWYIENYWVADPRYDVLYVASHGKGGSISDENDAKMSYQWLRNRIATKGGGRVVYLSGCETLQVSEQVLTRFTEATRAAAVAGYTKNVDWLESAAMDLIALGALAERGPGATGVWRSSPAETLQNVEREHAGFAARLGWRFHPGKDTFVTEPRRMTPDGTPEAIEALGAIATDDSVEAEGRARAINALTALAERSSLTTFTAVARDEDAPRFLRKAAIRGLGELHGKTALNSLKKLEEHFSSRSEAPLASAVRRELARRRAS